MWQRHNRTAILWTPQNNGGQTTTRNQPATGILDLFPRTLKTKQKNHMTYTAYTKTKRNLTENLQPKCIQIKTVAKTHNKHSYNNAHIVYIKMQLTRF